jgi:tRNA-dihydrouridine synthase B
VSTPPPAPAVAGTRPSVLAPMQDVTTTGFLRVIGRKGAPDWFVTEYFRVHESSTPEKHIVDSIVNHGTGRPVFAQLIGEDTPHMVRTIRALLALPVAGIDLNMGCPAPKVYRKNVGGGLLRDPAKIDELLGAMRQAIPGRFTVKMRIGFEDQRHFDAILALVAKHQVDLLTVHGRTVKGLYWSEVDYAAIAHAVRSVPCPVIANGDVATADKAQRLTAETGAFGMMMGRHAIRNPWIFRQWRETQQGLPRFTPTLADVRAYVQELADECCDQALAPEKQAGRLKKFLNFVGLAVDADGRFLHEMRRTETLAQLLGVCDAHLLGARAGEAYPDEPYRGLVARPTRETQQGCEL